MIPTQLLQDPRPARPTLIVSVRDSHHQAALAQPPPLPPRPPRPPPRPPLPVMVVTVLRQLPSTPTGTMQTESTR